jgi:hypothetical protein
MAQTSIASHSASGELLQEQQPFYLVKNEGFGPARPEDDYLHPVVNAGVNDDSLTETQYFGLEIP